MSLGVIKVAFGLLRILLYVTVMFSHSLFTGCFFLFFLSFTNISFFVSSVFILGSRQLQAWMGSCSDIQGIDH